MKPRLLCILHKSPPAHGAAKVGDYISLSKNLHKSFDCNFITIESSRSIGEIGKIKVQKIFLAIKLYFKVLSALLLQRPNKIYFTSSISGSAFYRDLFISILWKVYSKIIDVEIFYHYHTKGIDKFVSASRRNLYLTRFYIKDINIILLSPMLEGDFHQVQTYRQITFLPNGVEDFVTNFNFEAYLNKKYHKTDPLNLLYLSNMIKSKGYFEVLELANQTKNQSVHFHFAGAWEHAKGEKEFFDYIKKNNLDEKITFHGFVDGDKKQSLLKAAHFLIFPTRYEAESFPLVIIEAMSCGVPVIATNEGSIPYILDDKSGIIIDNVQKLRDALYEAQVSLFNKESAIYCRRRYLNNFTLEIFDDNFVNILKNNK
jgi:glycosyltransferase involved in cell wall biosynthesis